MDGKDGKDGADGTDGITPELLEKMQGYPDANTFATNTALFYLQNSLQQQIDGLLEKLSSAGTHNHANADVLDAFTAELLSDLNGLQQFEDNTKYEIQCINEALIPLQSARHTHNNQAILDSITAKMLEQLQHPPDTSHFVTDDVFQSVKDELQDALNEQTETISGVQKTAHQHKNQSVLDSLTASAVSNWNKAYSLASAFEQRITALESELQGVETLLATVVEVGT